jgi:ABC-2 type transport system permease protein
MSSFTGTGKLLRLALRRDRIQLPIWVVANALLLYAAAAAVVDEFPTEAERASALAGAGGSPAVLVMRGIPVGTSAGAFVNFRNYTSTLVLVALISTFMVVRHTRQNEETGRSELIGAGVVGRRAPLAAALGMAVIANIVLALAMTGTLAAASLPADGALLFGAACAVTGVAFAGLAALGAQLVQSARTANACAAAAIGVAYLVRGIGDALGTKEADGIRVASHWLTWLSPLGWAEQARPFGAQRWWTLALPLAFFAVCALGAVALLDRRDLGAGLLPQRLGPARGPRSLLSPLGLAWRLNRASTIGWLIGAALFGVGIGSLGDAVDRGLGQNKGMADLMGQLAGGHHAGLVDMYYAAMMNVFGVLAAAYVVQALLRLRSEETDGGAEAVLSTAVGRVRWVISHVVCAVAGAAALLLCAGLGTGLADAASGGAAGVGTLTAAGLAQLPAALTLGGFVVLAFGGLPRLVIALAWTGFAFALACGLFGDLLGLPQGVRDLSPFTHVPALPAADLTPAPLLALLAVAIALAAAGVALFRNRDLTP